MTLLTTVVERPLDPGYAAAADRREAAGEPRSTSLRSPLLVVATLVIGLVMGIAAYNLSAASTPRSKARAELITQIEQRRSQVEELTARATTLQSKVTDLEAEQLAGDPDADRNRDLAAVVGAIPLEGPGFTITVDDAPDAVDQDGTEGASDQADEGRVLAKDLQFVTNELWRSGAEAISINGKRLTSTSAIRFAGSAVIVDYRPLTRPYVITALGDPQRFPATFADGPGGTYLSTLREHVRHPRRHQGLERAPGPGRRGSHDAVRDDRGYWGLRHHTDPHHDHHTDPGKEHVVIPAIGLGLGIIIGLLLQPAVPVWLQPYLPIAVIAALDAVFGALRAILDGIFDDKVFVVSFLSNVLVAAFIVFLGDKLGVGAQLSTGVVVVLGIRIFSNVAAIRRHLFKA